MTAIITRPGRCCIETASRWTRSRTFVRTHDNISDFLTKPMGSTAAFFMMRAIVMNEERAREATPK